MESKSAMTFSIVCLVTGVALCPFWTPQYSVYLSPFNSLHFNVDMLVAYIYRFTIGFTLSTFVIFVCAKIKKAKLTETIASFGSTSLVIYTLSLALRNIIARGVQLFHCGTNEYVLIDVVALFVCLFVCSASVLLCNYCRKHSRLLSSLLLGE